MEMPYLLHTPPPTFLSGTAYANTSPKNNIRLVILNARGRKTKIWPTWDGLPSQPTSLVSFPHLLPHTYCHLSTRGSIKIPCSQIIITDVHKKKIKSITQQCTFRTVTTGFVSLFLNLHVSFPESIIWSVALTNIGMPSASASGPVDWSPFLFYFCRLNAIPISPNPNSSNFADNMALLLLDTAHWEPQGMKHGELPCYSVIAGSLSRKRIIVLRCRISVKNTFVPIFQSSFELQHLNITVVNVNVQCSCCMLSSKNARCRLEVALVLL